LIPFLSIRFPRLRCVHLLFLLSLFAFPLVANEEIAWNQKKIHSVWCGKSWGPFSASVDSSASLGDEREHRIHPDPSNKCSFGKADDNAHSGGEEGCTCPSVAQREHVESASTREWKSACDDCVECRCRRSLSLLSMFSHEAVEQEAQELGGWDSRCSWQCSRAAEH